MSDLQEMGKAYEPKGVEDAIYAAWLESGYFNPDNLPGERTETFSIMMPPPNVTGVLHLGHALENSLMDAMARYQRLQGKKVLLVPGTDHAALPTQAKVEKMLMSEGIKNPRQELGREALVEKIRDFAEDSKATILKQVKKMGTSADWSRLAYTFDTKRNTAVNELFSRMYKDGLIYRGYRVVNWSVKGQSTSSDDEIETVERPSVLYTFKYSKDFPIAISTTRPETKVGDTSVAVHPTDERYKEFVGKTYQVEFAGSKLSIKIIASEEVDPSFGTGALGVTPAHSAIDFGMYEAQKAKKDPIEIVQVIGIDGKMTKEAGSFVEGKTVEEAREIVVAWLAQEGLLESSQEIIQNVGTSDRYGDVIEAIPMTQWWLDVNKEIPGRGKTLADLMRDAVTTGLRGDENQKVTITPERETKLYLDRVNSLRDWCLSRQIWWGHRIPAWYRGEEVFVGAEAPAGEGWVRDEDTLDTWFSSASWTFSTLGWPEKTRDLEAFHPTSWIQMGYEIRYLWLMRMVLMSAYVLDEIPFKNAYMHGLLRDKDGKKFSKSSGNNIDPIDVMNEYGCDALRTSVLSGITPGNDSRYYTEKVESARNLVNKIWNISRFILANAGGARHIESVTPKTLADKWILSRFAETAQKVGALIERYDFSLAIEVLRDFTWNDFADWYLEVAKAEGEKEEILLFMLERLLVLWHPFMPFVTEEIYKQWNSGMLIVAEWPKAEDLAHLVNESAEKQFAEVQEVVVAIRNIRAQYKVEQKKELKAYLVGGESVRESERAISALTKTKLKFESVGLDANIKAGDLDALQIPGSDQMAKAVAGKTAILIPLAGMVDFAKERERLEKEIASVEKFVTQLSAKLGNAEFVARAPEAVITQEKQKLADAEARLETLRRELTSVAQ